jgi:hypothetical protein
MDAREIMQIDLNNGEVDLYGWERKKSEKVADYFIKAISSGSNIPPVPVLKISNTEYWLVTSDGGHNRSIAHYRANCPLSVQIMQPNDLWCRITLDSGEQGVGTLTIEKEAKAIYPHKKIHIKDIEVVPEDQLDDSLETLEERLLLSKYKKYHQ